jgi:hypothetical protein
MNPTQDEVRRCEKEIQFLMDQGYWKEIGRIFSVQGEDQRTARQTVEDFAKDWGASLEPFIQQFSRFRKMAEEGAGNE